MSEHDDEVHLEHIAEMASMLQRTARLGKDRFLGDADARDATIYRLQTMAESTQRLSNEFKAANAEIPWDDIARFRNRAVHGYLGVDTEIVWSIVVTDVPELSRCVRAELDRSRQPPGPTLERDRGRDIGRGRGQGL